MTYKDWAVADFRSFSGSPPLKYESPTLSGRGFIVKVTNPQARNTWRFAGYLSLLSLESFFEQGIVIRQEKLALNSAYLISGSDSDYHKINIDFPRWFICAEIVVWQAQVDTEKTAIANNIKEIKDDLDFQRIIDRLRQMRL